MTRYPSPGRPFPNRCLQALSLWLCAPALWFFAAPIDAAPATAAPVAAAESPTAPTVPVTMGSVERPLQFIANAGQFDPAVHFFVQQGSMSLGIGTGELTVKATPGEGEDAAVTVRFVDSNPSVAVEGRDKLPGVVNFYLGDDPQRWVTGVPTFASVAQVGLYEGITQLVQTQGSELKTEFRVSPGADPSKIQMQYSGAESLHISEAGDLVVTTATGSWQETAPWVYQKMDSRQIEVASSYRLLAPDRVGFTLGEFDPEQELVIDPLYFSTYLGGSDREGGSEIAIDGDGNILLIGVTESADFPLMNPEFNTHSGNRDLYVSKLDPLGNTLLYSTYLGGSSRELGGDLAVDLENNVYGVGWTASSNFPTTPGVFQTTYAAGGDDAAVFKLDPAGMLIYSTFVGGNSDDQPTDIAVDGAGQAFIVGYTSSSAYPTTTGAYSETVAGSWDVFITKLDATASSLVYSTFLGSGGYDEAMAMAIDAAGNAYVVGRTQAANFPMQNGGGGIYDNIYDGTDTAYLTKINPAGSGLVFSTFLDGIAHRSGSRQLEVEVDANQFVYVAMPYEGIGFPAMPPTTFDTTPNGDKDGVIMKVVPDGSGLVYSTFLGGSGDDRINGLVLGNDGSVYVTGSTTSTDFPLANAFDATLDGVQDVFVARLSPDGETLPFSTYLGGGESDSAQGIALSSRGPCVTGTTASTDFPTLAPPPFLPFQAAFAGGASDAFATCIDEATESEGCLTPPPGMVFWAPFDESFGTVSADLVAGNNGTHMGSAAPTTGIVADAIDLSGGHVEFGHSNDLNFGNEDFTVDFWMRKPAYPPLGSMVAKHDLGTGQGFEVYWDLCNCIPGAGLLFMNLNGVSHYLGFSVDENDPLPWTHVVIVVDRDDQLIYPYINGAPFPSVPIAILQSDSVDNDAPLLVGEAVGVFSDFEGQLDELELFNRSLSALEASELYAVGAEGKCKDGLHVGWDARLCEDPDHVVVSVEVCNYGVIPQTYELTFAPLPSGPGCSVAGPTNFENASSGALPPLTVAVPAQSCVPTPVRIGRPAGMVTHNQTGCYQVIRRNVTTGATRIVAGSVQDKRQLCPAPWPSELEPALSSELVVVPIGSTVGVTFPVGNTAAADVTVEYLIEAHPSDPEGSQVAVSLNGLPAGEPLSGTAVVPGLGTIGISVDAENVGAEPFAFYDLVISTSIQGQGGLVPFDSVGLCRPLPTDVMIANPDWEATFQDTPVIVDVVINDFASLGLDLSSLVVLLGSVHGGVTANGNGTLTYTPDPGFSGSDGLTYEICDLAGNCDTAAVGLHVRAEELGIIFLGGFETGNTSMWSSTAQ